VGKARREPLTDPTSGLRRAVIEARAARFVCAFTTLPPARDTARVMPAAGSDFLRAFREGFEQGNRAWNAGDVKAAYAVLPDQLEYQLAPTWPEARVLRSRDEVIEFFEDFQETFPDARTASHEYLEGARGTAVVGFRVAGTGRKSGAGSEMEIWQVWEILDQDNLTVTRVREFTDRRDALEAAGLSE
jgi:ketosteroid isomerase-like protein